MPGYDEIQKHDNLRLKDSKNQVILCFRCGLSSLGKREIISCDYCGLHWHLDCLNPPLANAPYRDPQNRAKYRWMCPAHADSMLTTIGLCGRLYKTRRPKNAEIVDTQLRRGFRSNGLVEIELDPSDDEMNIDETPKIYRLTETNIRLDFNDRLRKYATTNLLQVLSLTVFLGTGRTRRQRRPTLSALLKKPPRVTRAWSSSRKRLLTPALL